MNIIALSSYTFTFPDPSFATKEGVLAYGADLNPNRIMKAYSSGIFPWFKENDPILWWSPDPRFVLDIKDFKIPKSLNTKINKTSNKNFTIKYNTAFKEVINLCSTIKRKDQKDSWITKSMIEAYLELFELGHVKSFEYFEDDKLLGGGYGVILGDIFYGESMFSLKKDASKIAFIDLVRVLKKNNFKYIDCKIYSEHFKYFGTRNISREKFISLVKKSLYNPCSFET